MYRRILAACLLLCLLGSLTVGCVREETPRVEASVNTDVADMSAMNNTTSLLAGTDDLGRVVDLVTGNDESKDVGIFYLTWLGTYDAGSLHDVSKILEKDPDAASDPIRWLQAGGGPPGNTHWWGESLFGYYFSNDRWVIERDVQMLTDAGIDFLMLDYSNGVTYPEQWDILLETLDKFYRQGFEVPKLTFVIKLNNNTCVDYLYENYYIGKPEYDHLWYKPDGKPLLVCNSLSQTMEPEYYKYFNFRYAQWPKETPMKVDGLAWLDEGTWTEDGKNAIFGGVDGLKTIMTVQVADHRGTVAFSSNAFYGDETNHGRSWHDGAPDYSENAYVYGYNIGEQYEYALQCNPDIVFITGWNEWVATRQRAWNGLEETEPVILVDTANIESSRDIMPMKGGYGDNYYLQMMDFIRQYKGAPTINMALNTAAAVKPITMDMTAGMNQWNAVGGYYLDYIREIGDRKGLGYGGQIYRDETGRNDIYKMKVANDSENLYAYVQTMDIIQGLDGEHCLSMFISTGNENNEAWCGYDFVIGRQAATKDGLVIEKRTADGWEVVGYAKYSVALNELQFAIPLETLGLSAEDVSIQFKFADNYQGEDDIFSFYLNGDAAPYGRMNYVYESKGAEVIEKFEINPNQATPTFK